MCERICERNAARRQGSCGTRRGGLNGRLLATCAFETRKATRDADRLAHNLEVAAERRLAPVPRKRARLTRNCHGPVTSPALHAAPAGDAVRRFAQVSGASESLWDTGKRLESDWGSSGRRFKSCQPDSRLCRPAPISMCNCTLANLRHLSTASSCLRPVAAITPANDWLSCAFSLDQRSALFPAQADEL